MQGVLEARRLHNLLNAFQAQGIGEGFADVMISRLLGGWLSMPFEENLDRGNMGIFNRFFKQSSVIDGYLTQEEQNEARIIQTKLMNLSSHDRESLFNNYKQWFMNNIFSLSNSTATILGEIPEAYYREITELTNMEEGVWNGEVASVSVAFDFGPDIEHGRCAFMRADLHDGEPT